MLMLVCVEKGFLILNLKLILDQKGEGMKVYIGTRLETTNNPNFNTTHRTGRFISMKWYCSKCKKHLKISFKGNVYGLEEKK